MKNKTNPVVSQETKKNKDSLLGLFVRLYWIAFAYIPIIVSVRYIIKNNTKSFTKWDIIFWLTFISIVVLRYLDFKFLNGETTEGKPATIKDIRTSSITVFCILLTIYLVIKTFVHP